MIPINLLIYFYIKALRTIFVNASFRAKTRLDTQFLCKFVPNTKLSFVISNVSVSLSWGTRDRAEGRSTSGQRTSNSGRRKKTLRQLRLQMQKLSKYCKYFTGCCMFWPANACAIENDEKSTFFIMCTRGSCETREEKHTSVDFVYIAGPYGTI